MADFHQDGSITTLHRLHAENAAAIEQQLEAFTRRRPVALVLPCLFAEFSRPAIGSIIEHLRRARYIDSVVMVLGKATAHELACARAALSRLPQRVTVIWNDGPRVQAFYARLREHDLDPGDDGKGRSCWLGYGHVLADRRCQVIVAHDCDITTYDGELLARLCYPVVHPDLGFDFAKGYYARVNGTLNGRVTRLFVGPLLRALERIVGRLPLLDYLQGFRYPLSGEFAMTADLARVNRIPCNWGLEVGVLAEVYRNCARPRVCQTEVCAVYDHKHQVLAPGDATTGLLRMAVEVAQTLLRALASEGTVLSDAILKTLLAHYTRVAEDAVDAYEADAAANSLAFDRHREEATVDAFSGALRIATARHIDDPLAVRMMPSWRRVIAAIPNVLEDLAAAVAHDSRAAVVA